MLALNPVQEPANGASCQPAVRFVDLVKIYGGGASAPAVRGINLEVSRGEFLTLLGPSGSGKTTILMMLAGFEHPTRGDIFIDGNRMTDVPAHRRNLSMVFQGYALFPHRTVAQNIAFALEMRRRPRAEIAERVKKALGMVRLSGLADRFPHQLSGGQQQRVALARAIICDPTVLLMDEPLGALDKNLREEMQAEIKAIQNRLGNTVVYVTHDQQEALSMSDRIAVVNSGQIEQLGSPHEIYWRPESRFVAGFLGESNFIDGVVSAADHAGNIQVTAPDGTAISGIATRPIPVGTPGTLTIRLERVQLTPFEHVQFNMTGVSGIIEDIVFLGDTQKYTVNTSFGSISAKVQSSISGAKFAIGDRVAPTWQSSDARFLAR
jgi:spermidine/putrescine ABC transporter ATP-binding subunit